VPRFVILTHDHPLLHWDFLLECDAALRTWRLMKSPDSSGSISAEALPDHRLHYLDYEGPVGNGRGEVRQWDRGDYATVEESPSRVEVRLAGNQLIGTAVLQVDVASNWTFYFSAD